MPEKLYQSHSLEKTSEGISGSLTVWEDSPVSPFEVGDTFQPVQGCPPLTVEKVSIKDNIVGELFGKPVRQWEVTVEGSNTSSSSSETHVKYSFTISGSKKSGSMEVVNFGDSPVFSLASGDFFSVPGIGTVKCTEISGSDDYLDDGTRRWTLVYSWTDSFNEPDTKYNINIERDGNNTITTGAKTVTNSGEAPSDLTFGESVNLPGIGDLPLVKVSASDDYDDDGSHIWTVTHEGSNAPTQTTHDTKFNFTIERNYNNKVVKNGSKTVFDKSNNPSLAVEVGDTLNVPGIGDVTCVKVSGSDDYNDDGSRQWTIVYEGNDAPPDTKPEILYRIDIEKNSEGLTVYRGTKEFTYAGATPSVSEKVGDTLTFPIIGEVTCSRISSSNSAPNTWSIVIEGIRYGESSGTGDEGETDTSLPENEEYSTYDINGNTVRTVAGELLILRRSSSPILKKNIIIYDNNPSNISTLGSSYNDGIAISENITKETIKENGVVVKSYYKHTIEVEA